jgi:phosphoglycerate-specific signal transduction histidine kinase
MLKQALNQEKNMPLTPEEKKKLSELDEQVGDAIKKVGDAFKESSSTLLRSAARSLKSWAEDVEKALGPEKPEEAKKDEKKP